MANSVIPSLGETSEPSGVEDGVLTREDLSHSIERLCFVAMPIKTAGTPENAHYGGMYELIRSTVEQKGYRVLRADRTQRPGNINKEIITRLAEAALVIADLSDLNPNVFYELGVRHALRRSGTILLMDKKRTSTVPFDLASYRVIQYDGEIAGMPSFLADLSGALSDLGEDVTGGTVDSPVHDWYPELPTDVLESSRSATTREASAEIAELRRQVERYRDQARHTEIESSRRTSSAQTLISSLRQAIGTGEVASGYISLGETAVANNDVAAFLDAADKFLSAKDDPQRLVYLQFWAWAKQLGQQQLGYAILEEAAKRLPDDPKLTREIYLRLAQSDRRQHREEAKQWFADSAGIDLEKGEFKEGWAPATYSTEIGHLLEILHQDGEDLLGLRILEAAIATTGDVDEARRDRARQLDWLNRLDDAMEAYISGLSNTLNQEGIRWFGNFLHNNGWHVEALELFLLEAFVDQADPSGGIAAADELSFEYHDYFALKSPRMEDIRKPAILPAGFSEDDIRMGLLVALSCPKTLSSLQREKIARICVRAEIDAAELMTSAPLAKSRRLEWISSRYLLIASDLTEKSPVALRLRHQVELARPEAGSAEA